MKTLVAALAAGIVVLAVALVVVLARDDSAAEHAAMSGGAMGMMQAMGNMDSDAMLAHMREVLGDAGYQRMTDHFRDHRSGGAMTGDATVDQMMHQMMDGMFQQMPDDRDRLMPRMGGGGAMPTATPR